MARQAKKKRKDKIDEMQDRRVGGGTGEGRRAINFLFLFLFADREQAYVIARERDDRQNGMNATVAKQMNRGRRAHTGRDNEEQRNSACTTHSLGVTHGSAWKKPFCGGQRYAHSRAAAEKKKSWCVVREQKMTERERKAMKANNAKM